jgi:predicted dehydrogenase
VIGAGKFAEACHIPGLQSHPQAEVVAICGRREGPTRALADRFNIPGVYIDYEELCARHDLDAVSIVTPNVEHARQARTALASGKHVFCEKPLAMTVAEARDMLCEAEVRKKINQVAFTYRYLYGVQELKRRMLKGDIGSPYYLRLHWECWDAMHPEYTVTYRDKQEMAGGGVLYDVGSHLSDLSRFILGPLERVMGFTELVPRERLDGRTGIASAVETDDIAGAWFMNEHGVRGQWFASRVTPAFDERSYLEVIGQEGALRASLSRGSVDQLHVSSPVRPGWEQLPLPEEAKDRMPHCLGMMMRSFVDACLRGKPDNDVAATFQDGFAAQQMLAAVVESNVKSTWVHL